MPIYRQYNILVQLTLLALFSITTATVHIDTRGIMSRAEGLRDSNTVVRTLWSVENDIRISIPVSRSFSFLLHNKTNGGLRSLRLDERTVPFVNNVYLGVVYDFVSQFYAGFANDLLGASSAINPPYITDRSSMKQRALSLGEIGLHLNLDKWKIHGDLHYFRLNYAHILNRDTNVTIINTNNSIDDDLWSSVDISFYPTDKFHLSLGTHLKSDFNEEDAFNFGQHYLGIGGDFVLPIGRGRIFLPWSIAEQFRVSEQLYLRNEAEGLATIIDIRPTIKLRKRRYMKFAAKLDLSSKMKKQWYAVSYRKALKNKSYLEAGYWSVSGSYFPRQAYRLQASFVMGRFSIKPSGQFYLRRDLNNDTYRYYRTDLVGELLLAMTKSTELYGGILSSYYNSLRLYKTEYHPRINIYLGIRKW